MNQTHLRGFDQVQSAFSFIATQIEAYDKKQLKKLLKRKLLAKRVATALTTLLLVISTNVAEIKAQDIQVIDTPVNQPVFSSEVRFDRTTYSLLVIDTPKVEIKPGKSVAQQQAEEARARQIAQQLVSKSQVSTTVTRSQSKVTTSIEEARRMAKEAAAKAGIPEQWKYLEAVWQVESGKAVYSCVISGADGRAMGPMQFMPGTFRAYKPHANADICNAVDALHAAANLLKRGGIAEGNVDGAIHNYNHSMAYVNKVKSIANSIN